MDAFTRDDLRNLLTQDRRPCVSFFMATNREAKREENETRWKDLLRQAEQRLEEAGCRSPEARELLRSAHDLLADSMFWRGVGNGLAAFLAPGEWRPYRLPLTFRDEVTVGSGFDVAQLVLLFTGEGRYHALLLSERDVRLFEAERQRIRERPLRDEGGPLRGVDLNTDTRRDGTLRFYERLNKHLTPLFQRYQVPLVLAGPKELTALYRQANTFDGLVDPGYECGPAQVSEAQVHQGTWEALQKHTRAAWERVLGIYGQLAGKGEPLDNLAAILPAAHRGQLQYLLVARGQQCWGRFDPQSGRAEVHAQKRPGDRDLLALAVAHTLAHKGQVYALEPNQIPGHAPAAAVPWLPGFGERTDQRVVAETPA